MWLPEHDIEPPDRPLYYDDEDELEELRRKELIEEEAYEY